MTQFLDSIKRVHTDREYTIGATQHQMPFDYGKGYFFRAYSNTYTTDRYNIVIRHYYGVGDKSRWTCIRKYHTDRHYTIEVYDSVCIKGDHFYKTVFTDVAYNLRDAVHLANAHKSDK